MAKLPERQKVSVLCFRRVGPDEVLVVPLEVKRQLQWGVPSTETEPGESTQDAALRVAMQVSGQNVAESLDLGVEGSYRVKAGPRAGEWTERFHAVELAPERRPREGRWLPHYEAKALVGPDAPRVREAFTRLRELARLKP